MRRHLSRWWPFLTVALLMVINIGVAIVVRTRDSWISVALLALACAAILWRTPSSGV